MTYRPQYTPLERLAIVEWRLDRLMKKMATPTDQRPQWQGDLLMVMRYLIALALIAGMMLGLIDMPDHITLFGAS